MTYKYVKPTEEELEVMNVYRRKFQELHDSIEKHISGGRGKSLCLTKLEESAMWLNKGITKND